MRRTQTVLAMLAVALLLAIYTRANADAPAKATPAVSIGYLIVEPTTVDGAIDWNAVPIVQRTQAALLVTQESFEVALTNENAKLRETKWFKSFADTGLALHWLREHVHADAVAGSQLIEVSIDAGPTPQEGRSIIETLGAVRMEADKSSKENLMLDRMSVLNQMKMRQEQQLRDLMDRLNNLIVHINGIGLNTAAATNVSELELKELITRRAEAMVAGKKDFDAVDKRIDELKSTANDSAIAMGEFVATAAEVSRLRTDYAGTKKQLEWIASNELHASIRWIQQPELVVPGN